MLWFERKLLGLAFIFSACVLSACGFQLQGSAGYPDSLATIYIDAPDRYSEFYRGLGDELRQHGSELVGSVVAASAVIRIENDESGQNVLTVSGRNVPTEYDVFYTVRYSVSLDGEEVLAARTLTLRQDYTYDATLVLGKKREEQEIRQALARGLVRQVSQQLSRL